MQYKPADSGIPQEVYRELLRIGQLLLRNQTGAIEVLAVAPERPSDGDVAICDGASWDPLNDGVKRPVWFDEDALVWKAF